MTTAPQVEVYVQEPPVQYYETYEVETYETVYAPQVHTYDPNAVYEYNPGVTTNVQPQEAPYQPAPSYQIVEDGPSVQVDLDQSAGTEYMGISASGSLIPEQGATTLEELRMDVRLQARVTLGDLPGQAGVAAESVSGGEGVHSLTRAQANLSMVIGETGLAVDGHRFQLGELGPLYAEIPATVGADTAVRVRAQLAHAQLPERGGELALVLEIEGNDAIQAARPRLAIHIVVDRSSSMQSTWGSVLQAAQAVAGQLRPDDTIQIVAYGSEAAEVLPPTPVGNGRTIVRAVSDISVGGGTNIEAGLRLAYESVASDPVGPDARSVVLLLSDGVPNGGAFHAEELAPLAGQAFAAGCTTTVVGIGHQFDADVLQAIAGAGGGSYLVAASAAELAPVLRAEMDMHQPVAARDVVLDVMLAPNVEFLEIPEGWHRTATGISMRLSYLDAAQLQRVVSRVRIQGFSEVDDLQSVARVRVSYYGPQGPESIYTRVSVSVGQRAEFAGNAPIFAVADRQLGEVLKAVSPLVLNGQTRQASAMLRAHVQRSRSLARTHSAIAARSEAIGRFATTLDSLLPGSSHSQRRELSIALGGLSLQLSR